MYRKLYVHEKLKNRERKISVLLNLYKMETYAIINYDNKRMPLTVQVRASTWDEAYNKLQNFQKLEFTKNYLYYQLDSQFFSVNKYDLMNYFNYNMSYDIVYNEERLKMEKINIHIPKGIKLNNIHLLQNAIKANEVLNRLEWTVWRIEELPLHSYLTASLLSSLDYLDYINYLSAHQDLQDLNVKIIDKYLELHSIVKNQLLYQ